MAELPDKKPDTPPPRLFPAVTELFANGALVGAVYFGGMKLAKKYGLSKAMLLDAKQEADEFLVRRGVMRPRPTSQTPRPSSSLNVAERTALAGPQPPSTPIPRSPLFGIPQDIHPAALRKLHEPIVQAIEHYTALLGHSDPSMQLLAREALSHVIREMQQQLLDPSMSRFGQLNVRKIAAGDHQEINKVWDLLKPATVSADAEYEAAHVAMRLLATERRLLGHAPGPPLEEELLEAASFEDLHDALEQTGSASDRAALLNARGVTVQKHLWHQSRLHGELTASKIHDLDTVLNRYDPTISMGAAAFHTAPNKRGLRKILTTMVNTQGVDAVSLVSVEEVTAQHHVAVIRVSGAMMGDPTKKWSKLVNIPLLSERNTFVPGSGQNVRASWFSVPEQVGTDIPGAPVHLRLGGTHPEDYFTGMDRLSNLVDAHFESFVRELAQDNEPRARSFWRTHMLGPAFLDQSQIEIAQNLYGHFYGGRVSYNAQEVLRDRKALQLRVDAMHQYTLLQGAKTTGRSILYLDIETVSPVSEAHPLRKMESADTEPYQISALLKDPKGNTIGAKMWWVRTKTEVSPQWAQHAAGPGEDWQVHKAWLESNIQKGVPLEQALRELKDFAVGPGGDFPVVVSQYGGVADVGTIVNIAQRIDAGLGQAFQEIWSDKNQADIWKMHKVINRAMNQSHELGHIARSLGIRREDIEEAFKRHVSHLQIRGGNNKTIGEDLSHYMRQHSSMFDDFMTSFVTERILLGDSYVTHTLGNTAERDLFEAALSGKYRPDLRPAMLNMDKYYEQVGMPWDDTLYRLLFPGGHPTTHMGMGMRNVMNILGFSPLADWGTSLRRGPHKRINTARQTDAAIRYLTAMDPHRGHAPGSSFLPHLMTEQTLQHIQSEAGRAEYLGHVFNARIFMADQPYATQGNVLLTDLLSRAAQTEFRQYNYGIPLPNPGAGHTMIRARVVGVSQSQINPDLVTPGQYKEHARPFTVRGGQWMVVEYETEAGIAYTSQQYEGRQPFKIIESELVGRTLYLGRKVTQDVRMGSRGTLLGNNVTVSPSEDLWTRGEAMNPAAQFDIIANLSEGYTKYWEHGKSAEVIFGKLFDPLIEAVRRGGEGSVAARQTLERMTGLLGLGAARVTEVVNRYARQHGVKTPTPMATIVLATQSQERYDELMRQGLTWQNITDLYTEINALDKRHPGIIPSFMKYGHGETQELIDMHQELATWTRALTDELAQARHRLDAQKDQSALQDVRNLEKDLQELTAFGAVLQPGTFKYGEYGWKMGPSGARQRFFGIATVGSFGIGAKDPVAGSGIFPIETVEVNPVTQALERIGGPRRTYAGKPSGGLRMRAQSLELTKNAMEAVHLDPTHIETLMGGFHKHLAREQLETVALTLHDLEFIMNQHDKLPEGMANIQRLTFTDLKPQLERIRQGVEDMRGMVAGSLRVSYEAHVRMPNGAHEVYDIPDVGSREVAEQFLKEKLGPDIHITALNEQTIGAGTSMERGLAPEVVRGTFLSATTPFVVSIPEELRPYLTLSIGELEDELRTVGVRESRVLSLAMQLKSQWREGRNELRFPALNLVAPGRRVAEGMTYLSSMQVTVMNLLDRLVNHSADIQHPEGIQAALTNYLHQAAEHGVGRHKTTGLAVTAILPGLRGVAIPSEASPMFLNHPEMLTSKYNALHTTLMSKSDAERMNLGEYLTNLYPDNPTYVREIMEGKQPLMDILEREAHNYTTSAIAVQTYIVPDNWQRADRAARRSVRLRTLHVGGPDGVVVSMSRELFQMVYADSDGDFVSKIFMGAKTREDHNAIQESSRALYTAQTTPFMQHRSFLHVDNIIPAGTQNARGQDNYLMRQEVYDPTLHRNDYQYVLIDEATPEGASILRTRRAQQKLDAKMGKQHSSLRPGMQFTTTEDATMSHLLDRWTGRVTMATWDLRTAFDLLEQDGSISQELKDRLAAARTGTPYPRQLVNYKGKQVYAHEVPIAELGAITTSLVEPADRPIADVLGDLIQTLTIAKGASVKDKEAGIADLLIGLNANTPEGQRIRALGGITEKQRAILQGHEDLIVLLADKYRKMQGEDVIRTMVDWTTSARDPAALEVLTEFNDLLNKRPELDWTFAANLLFRPKEQLNQQERTYLAQIHAEDTMRGAGEPKYFAKRGMRSELAEMLGTESERLRRPGIAIAAAAGLFTLLPVGLFVGPNQGTGGEKYDYWGDGPQLPSNVPLDAPQYTWDPSVMTNDMSVPSLTKMAQVQTERLAQSAVQQLTATWNHPIPLGTTMTYRDHRQHHTTTQRLRREHRSVAQFQ